jgi:ATP synthase protein I
MNGKGPEQPGASDGERDAGGTREPKGLDERRRLLAAELAERSGKSAGSAAEPSGRKTGYADAFRLSSEFIGGVVVGGAIGWIFDRVLGTSPWGLIVFLLLGFGAGVLNVLRSAGLASQGFGSGVREPRNGPSDGSPGGPGGADDVE